MNYKFRKTLKFIYPILDILVTFVVLMISFLSLGRSEINIVPCIIYSLVEGFVLAGLFVFAKVYKIETDEIGLFDSLSIVGTTAILNIAGFVAVCLIRNLPGFREYFLTFLLTTITLCGCIAGIRFLPRFVRRWAIHKAKLDRNRTIVIGAGAAAKIIIEETFRNFRSKNNIVALVDDDRAKIGGTYHGLPIEGPIENVLQIIENYGAEEVIIAISNLKNERLQEILHILSEADVRVKRMPLLTEMDGPNDVKIVEVHLEELLGREPIKLDNSEMYSMLKGKTVLVTGAGGSIGSELVRQIFLAHPDTLVLFDIYENATYEIQQELIGKMRNENIKDIKLVTLIGSTYNEIRVEQIMRKYRPDYIYHAAAYKHVPLMEDSPAEAIRTNVIGTYNVAKLADKYQVKKMVLVSTDKAVRPTNVMGATKRFAETIIQYFSSKSKDTAYAAVRFGNVLGSNGSVVPLFKKQIEQGGPITLTHKDIIRYFMTIPEASSLILQCGLYAKGGEIFILDMGNPVKIYDLAVKLIKQAGLVPGKDIKIVETGLRPGEKLYEELLLDKEKHTKTANKRIFIEKEDGIKPIEEEILEISKVFELDREVDGIKTMLKGIIETYVPEGGK